MIDKVFPELKGCKICPHDCGVDRYSATGFCHSTANIKYNLHQKHFGEEPIISGSRGSGTIFFSNCNLACVFCQNYSISQFGNGSEITIDKLVEIMFELADNGVHNINLVSPTQYTPQIREAIIVAKSKGLDLPIVWNSNGYEKVETLKTLEGLVDIYLPDFKYSSAIYGKKYSIVSNYPQFALDALKEMFRQVGHIKHTDGIAESGLLVRLLVLPKDVSGVSKSLYQLYDAFGNKLYISLMGQYYPTHKATNMEILDTEVESALYERLSNLTTELGFENAFVQECGSNANWTPKFTESDVRQ
ncbi:MAG: radical SAM protein [Candidatus Zophobacter franzmannii]|nr:radical SAM protein [Candidatus Zophobacter franzmannii]